MPKTISVAVPEACTLCPRQCKADRAAGQTGFCGAGRTLKAARAALHFWDTKFVRMVFVAESLVRFHGSEKKK